ncbi:MAG: hypothetical protein ACOYB3_01550 [Azonexus sp.]
MTPAKWRKEVAQQPELQAADQFYREYLGDVEPGKKIKYAGSLAAYTFDWPEYDHWISYGGNDKMTSQEHRDFYGNPSEQWKGYAQGVVYYSGRPIYIKGKGSYVWNVEWSYGSGNGFEPQVKVDLEFWDRDRIWHSHWKKPVLWDYKKEKNTRPGTAADWDEAHPDIFDTMEFDQAIKDRLVKQAKAFVEKLGQVAQFTRVRWNVPELYVPESMDDMLQQMGDVASGKYTEYLNVFTKVFNRTVRATHSVDQELDEACWRSVIIHAGLSDDAICDRAWRMAEAGYEVYREEKEIDDAWDDASVGLHNLRPDGSDVALTSLHSGSVYDAFKKLWYFRYRDQDSFENYADSITEAKPTWGNEGKNEPTEKGFVQISGDFGSPWDYGGTWFNEATGDLVHFPGLDGDSKDIEPDDSRIDSMLNQENYNAILKVLHLDEDTEWENIEDEVRSEHAATLNAARKFTYYRTTVEDDKYIEKDYPREIADIKAETEQDDETWAALPPSIKQSSIADRIGWHEFDHYPVKITRAELSSLLGIDL